MVQMATKVEEKKALFLEGLLKYRYISRTCAAMGYRRTTIYEWAKDDPGFKQSLAEAKSRIDEMILEEIEQALAGRAVDGVDKPITWQGEVTGYYKEYSDTAAIFLAKGLNPAKYRDNYNIKIDATESLGALLDRMRDDRVLPGAPEAIESTCEVIEE